MIKKQMRNKKLVFILLLSIMILTAATGLFFLLPADASSVSVNIEPDREPKLVGYYAAWASYSGYTPNRIDASHLTHINYAFAKIGKGHQIEMGYPDLDPQNFKQLSALKKVNPALKTLISVGGWTWSGEFSDTASSDTARKAFAKSCVKFIKQYGFDGIDIDWEYPTGGGLPSNGKSPADKHNFTLLLQELRKSLDDQGAADHTHYLLTIAGGAGSSYSKNTELSKIHPYLDYATIMTYDLHGSWDRYSDLLAPLYDNSDVSPQYKSSADSSVGLWLKSGFPAEKLVMGIPFYGYQYQISGTGNHGLYSKFQKSKSIGYDLISKQYLHQKSFQRYFHDQSKVPWLYDGSVFITYEDPESIAFKTDYIKSRGLGGAMVWELSQDQEQVLLNAVSKAMSGKPAAMAK